MFWNHRCCNSSSVFTLPFTDLAPVASDSKLPVNVAEPNTMMSALPNPVLLLLLSHSGRGREGSSHVELAAVATALRCIP